MAIDVRTLFNFEHTRMQKVIRRSDSKEIQGNKRQAWSCIAFVIIFIYCNWVSTTWQWSIKLYKIRKKDSYIQKEEQYTKEYQNTEYGNRKQHTKQESKHTKKIKKHDKKLQWYSPITREEANGISARQSTVQSIVLVVFDG